MNKRKELLIEALDKDKKSYLSGELRPILNRKESNMKVGEYSYSIHGRNYRIYVCDYSDGKIQTSSPVRNEPLYIDREEARKRVYELNGWKYKPKMTKHE